jgi:hypothetical protein
VARDAQEKARVFIFFVISVIEGTLKVYLGGEVNQ